MSVGEAIRLLTKEVADVKKLLIEMNENNNRHFDEWRKKNLEEKK